MKPILWIILLLGTLEGPGAVWAQREVSRLADEFVGPFPSWANLKADYGAVGDGQVDDTAALQKALDDMRPATGPRVLYLPAGVYRITRTLNVLREAHTESMGLSILGEDPATTILRWDGPEGGVMLYYSAWYSRLGRLTLDGAGRAMTAIRHGQPFATANEYADLVFQDVGFGLEAGERDGIAETAVLRCRFLRCSQAGLNIQNFNSLDWWLWYCLFEDCHIGVSTEYHGSGGHFHVYESLFRRSTEADLTIKHCSYFGIRHNTSLGSKAFFLAKRADNWTDQENWGAQVTLQGNTILDPQDATPIRIANAGNVLLLDNVIRSRSPGRDGRPARPAGPVVQQVTPAGEADLVSVGNTFTVENPLEVKGRLIACDDRVVSPKAIKARIPALPGTPPNRQRKVWEVPRGAPAAEVQRAIDEAAKWQGPRPVVHVPAGIYSIDRTLVIPANCDMQLVGDGILYTTQLQWVGPGAGPVLRLAGPSRATLRDFTVLGGNSATGIVIEDCDQPEARLFMEGTQVGSAQQVGLWVDRLEQADVSLHDFGHSGCKVGVKVVGGPQAARGRKTAGRVAIFSGASSNNDLSYEVVEGGRLLARDIWYETNQQPRFIHLTGRGAFTLHGANVAAPCDEDHPLVEVNGFQGDVALLGVDFVWWKPHLQAIQVHGEGADTHLLLLGCLLMEPQAFANHSPRAQVAFLHNRAFAKEVGTVPIPNQGQADPAFLRRMLAPTRQARPRLLRPIQPGITDVRLYRVFVFNTQVGLHLKAGR